MELRYSILDPTGNITALAESPVEAARQPDVAAEIMRRHPEVEQVGFLRPAGENGIAAELRMAGGEFCGNASMCAAALCLPDGQGDGEKPADVRLRVSGASRPVEVRLLREGADNFRTEILMPPALGLEEREFSFEGLRGTLPLVRLEGISHLIVGPDSAFFGLFADRGAAERAVRDFCAALEAEGLGLLFLEGDGCDRRLTPLVYIPGSGTTFWETSCASGSAAAGLYLAEKSGAALDLALQEPGGTLRVKCDPRNGETRLSGRVRIVARLSEIFSESC